jgi:hypothetical protein
MYSGFIVNELSEYYEYILEGYFPLQKIQMLLFLVLIFIDWFLYLIEIETE